MNPRVRLAALAGAWGVLVLLVGFAIHAIAPFADAVVSIVGCGAVGVAIVVAARVTKDKRAFDTTTIFDVRVAIGSLAIVIGGAGGVGFLLHDHWHAALYVFNNTDDTVRVTVDGRDFGTVGPSAFHEVDGVLPTNADRITVADRTGKPVETADVDAAAGDGGRYILDVGGAQCWEIRTVHYTSITGLGGEDETVSPIQIGEAHLFLAKADYIGEAPRSVSSKSSSEARTLLEPDDCHGRAR